MLSGIEMPHYLSLTNMFAKFLGLICTLAAGSTVFLGKVVRDVSVCHTKHIAILLHCVCVCGQLHFEFLA